MWVWGTKLKQRSLVSLHRLLSPDSLKGVRVPLPPDAGRFPFTGEIYSCFHGDKWESQWLLCIGHFLGNFNSELTICHWGTCWAACPRGPCLIHLCRAPLLLRWSTRVVVKWMGKETCAVGLLLREACPSELWDRIHNQTQKASRSLYLQMRDVTGLEVWPPGE